jgi:FkbM family methyltransferase
MCKKLYYLLEQLKRINRINRTFFNKIESSSVGDNGFYIKFSNGKHFTGQKANKHLRRLHFLLKKQLRKRISADLMQVLFDIDFRYMSRKNHALNLKEGKYLGVKKGDVVFEVGAYIGYHAMRLSELVGNSGKIIAIEAIPSNYEIMKKNIEMNDIKNIIPINVAIWKNKGVIPMNMNEHQKNSAVENIVNANKKVDLPCDTIDNIFRKLNIKEVDFVRIQTNGAELEALEGMVEILEHRPKLLVAVPYKNKDVIQNLLNSKGYNTEFTGHSIFAE